MCAVWYMQCIGSAELIVAQGHCRFHLAAILCKGTSCADDDLRRLCQACKSSLVICIRDHIWNRLVGGTERQHSSSSAMPAYRCRGMFTHSCTMLRTSQEGSILTSSALTASSLSLLRPAMAQRMPLPCNCGGVPGISLGACVRGNGSAAPCALCPVLKKHSDLSIM